MNVALVTRVLLLVADGSVAEPRFNSVDPRLIQKPGLASEAPPVLIEQIINTLLDVADGVIACANPVSTNELLVVLSFPL
jgi:hypothetical protein